MIVPFSAHSAPWQSHKAADGYPKTTPRCCGLEPRVPVPSALSRFSPCNHPLPAELGCREEAGKLSSLGNIVQVVGMLCHSAVSVRAEWLGE